MSGSSSSSRVRRYPSRSYRRMFAALRCPVNSVNVSIPSAYSASSVADEARADAHALQIGSDREPSDVQRRTDPPRPRRADDARSEHGLQRDRLL